MDKKTGYGLILTAIGFALLILKNYWGIDGTLNEISTGIIASGLTLLGLKGLWDAKKTG